MIFLKHFAPILHRGLNIRAGSIDIPGFLHIGFESLRLLFKKIKENQKNPGNLDMTGFCGIFVFGSPSKKIKEMQNILH